ncbi:ATP synthase subunit e, mitochondrial-like [Dermacentor silvarum]|uniref:ATP synthase subunit e, mitochondrial-like n=1 Tax=Dermacentor silvarum TaxID=543639 RepID=UPI00189C141E|nr:ATP synthase subunit e, mitochondrial-like [Dermacentor silvarum]
MVELAPPVSVSPFIRACRWGFLTAGILYGAFNYRRLSRKETKIREYEAQQMEMLKGKREAEKQKKMRDEMITLAKDVGVPVPPNF